MFVDVFHQDNIHTQRIIWLGGRSLQEWWLIDWQARYSKDCSMRSCLSTFVWLVSLISPARNISSTTVYTWNTTATGVSNSSQLVLQQFIQKRTLSYLICKTSKLSTFSKLPEKLVLYNLLHAFGHLIDSLYFLASKHMFSTFSSRVFLLWNHYRYWNIVSNNLILDWINFRFTWLSINFFFFFRKNMLKCIAYMSDFWGMLICSTQLLFCCTALYVLPPQ